MRHHLQSAGGPATVGRRCHLFLRESLDTDRIAASYDQGVLTLRIPVAEQAKPRKVEITAGTDAQPANSTSGWWSSDTRLTIGLAGVAVWTNRRGR
jgi:hypothetical protein